MIKMGHEYEDIITGYKGTCTGYVQYITGCNQALLIPKVKEDGKRNNGEWFDEQRLEPTGYYNPKIRKIASTKFISNPGCDVEAPKK